MSIARVARYILSVFAISIVAWSFFDVGRRAWNAQTAEHDRPITLTILHWGEPAEDHIVDVLTKRFMQLHPQVRIVRVNPGADFYEDKLKTMIAAGTPPDVFYLQTQMLPEMAGMKLIAPISQRFAAEPQQWRDDFFAILLDAFTYNLGTERFGPGGTLYGIPKDFTTTGFYVNCDLFQKAGLRVPYDGWTWQQYEDDCKKITALTGTPGFEQRKIYGSVYEIWADTLRAMLWTAGGDFFGPGGFRDVTLNSPASQAALQLIYRTRLVDHTSYNVTGIGNDGSQEFFAGNIGCDGPVGRWKCTRFASITNFKWDFVPAPRAPGVPQSSQLFTNSWAMSSASKYPDMCWELMKFLTGRDGQVMQSRLGLAIPCLRSVAYSDDFLKAPGVPPMHAQTFLNLISAAKVGQLPKQTEFIHIVNDNITKSIQLGEETTMQSADRIRGLWLNVLDSPLNRPWPTVRWGLICIITGAVCVLAGALLVWRARREELGPLDRATERAGWMFIAPWVIGFVALTLGPMLVSLLLSFAQWTGMTSLASAQAVGTANYRVLAHDPLFYQSLKVTLYYVVLAVPLAQIASLAIALLMNLKVKGIEFFRTIYFVPSVVSGVALATMWWQVFNNDYGPLNKILRPIAHLLGTSPPDWFGLDAARWAVPGFVLMGLWGVGSGMIIYLAGLKGISASLYEASTIDGAGPLRRLWNITLPMLSPLIFYNLVMGIIASFQVFTQAYVMTHGDGRPDNTSLFYVLNLYRQAFVFHHMGYGSAMAWVLFLIILALTLAVFRFSKNLVYYEGLKT